MAARYRLPADQPTAVCPHCEGTGAHRARLQAAWTSPTRAVDRSPADIACPRCHGLGRVLASSVPAEPSHG